MRYILSFLIIASFALAGNAQYQFRSGFMEDTLTNAETAYLYPADAATAATAPNFRDFGALEVVIVSDSLSGATAGTATLQYCFDENCTYTYDAATLTINGAAQQVSRTEDTEFVPLKFRVKFVTTGTQSTRERVYYTWKRKI